MQTRIFLLFICLLLFITIPVHGTEMQTGVIKGDNINLRAEPSLEGRIISVLKQGSMVTIMEQTALWFRVQLPNGQTGWVSGQFVKVNPLTRVASGEYCNTLPLDEIIAYAKNLKGTRYVYGGQSPRGFDCSGFTMHVFAKFGFNLPHRADLQMRMGMEVLTREDLVPGDLVFFRTKGSKRVNHVGIYLGDGWFIHASSGYGSVRVTSLNSDYYFSRYVGACRLSKDYGIN